MSSLENSNRGALAAMPDPATFYRRKFLCAAPAGGGKGKRHPGKAILAGEALIYSSYFYSLSVLFSQSDLKDDICLFEPACFYHSWENIQVLAINELLTCFEQA